MAALAVGFWGAVQAFIWRGLREAGADAASSRPYELMAGAGLLLVVLLMLSRLWGPVEWVNVVELSRRRRIFCGGFMRERDFMGRDYARCSRGCVHGRADFEKGIPA